MSVAGILSTAAFSLGAQIFQNRAQKLKQEFQQLGQDLQSGNLSAAQGDFATIQKMKPQPPEGSSSQGADTIGQDFNQLATDLKSGQITAAQQDFTKLQQDFQGQSTQTHRHHHQAPNNSSDAIAQLFTQLGLALQSGNLSVAQQAYSTMLQDFQQSAAAGVAGTSSRTSALSVSA